MGRQQSRDMPRVLAVSNCPRFYELLITPSLLFSTSNGRYTLHRHCSFIGVSDDNIFPDDRRAGPWPDISTPPAALTPHH